MSLTMEAGRQDPVPPVAAHTELQRQLLACAGLFTVFAEQLNAGVGTDVADPCGRALRAERARAEQAVRVVDGGGDGQSAPEITVEVSRALQQALDVLDGRPEEEQRLRDWIGALQDASLPLMRSLVARPGLVARAVQPAHRAPGAVGDMRPAFEFADHGADAKGNRRING